MSCKINELIFIVAEVYRVSLHPPSFANCGVEPAPLTGILPIIIPSVDFVHFYCLICLFCIKLISLFEWFVARKKLKYVEFFINYPITLPFHISALK